MASAAQQLRERIAFEMNVPVEIGLDRDGNPTETTARDGSAEYRYFLHGHKIAWLPDAVHQAIQRAQAGDSAWFALTKHRAPKPWTVIHLDAQEPAAAQPPQQPAARPAPAPAPAATQERTAQGWIAREAPAAAPLASLPRRPLDAPQQRQLDEPGGDASPMYGALCAAIRTAAAAERFAASIGRPLAFETQDIRAIAATLFIRETGGGR